MCDVQEDDYFFSFFGLQRRFKLVVGIIFHLSWISSKLDEYPSFKDVSLCLQFQNKNCKNNQRIGCLYGTILPCSAGFFYEMGDSTSGELELLTTVFCDYKGHTTRIDTNLEGRDVYTGGFFHISSMEIDKAHKGKNL